MAFSKEKLSHNLSGSATLRRLDSENMNTNAHRTIFSARIAIALLTSLGIVLLVVEGLAAAYRTQRYLQQQQVSSPSPLSKVTILSGPSFFETTKQAITMALATLPRD